MKTLSAVIITRNEAASIGRCLESVRWADERIVVDSGSTDDTCRIAREAGAQVFHKEWQGYGPAKQFGVEKASSCWVLSIDADEEVTPLLAEEIRGVLGSDSQCHGYYVPRCTLFLGRWIRHCGWYPDHVLRLFRKEYGQFDNAPVHEKVILSGPSGYLRQDLLHYCYPTLERYLDKSNQYTTLGAEIAYQAGRRARWFDIVVRPPASFIAHYVVRQGFRDGIEGFLLSVLSAKAVMVKYAKLRRLQQAGGEVSRNE